MKTLPEKIVDSIMVNLSKEHPENYRRICESSLEHAVRDIIRSKGKIDSELSTTLTPKLLNTIEELLRNDY